MFGGVRQNSIIYVLDKSEKPNLKIGQLATISNPYPKYQQGTIYTPNAEQVVDISVKTNDGTLEFKQLPTSLSIANSGNVVVSDSRDAMLSEVEGMRRTSQEHLDSVNYHQSVVESCDEMIAVLNPQIAREKENEQRIGAMEERMGGIEGALSNIQEMLTSALRTTKSK